MHATDGAPISLHETPMYVIAITFVSPYKALMSTIDKAPTSPYETLMLAIDRAPISPHEALMFIVDGVLASLYESLMHVVATRLVLSQLVSQGTIESES